MENLQNEFLGRIKEVNGEDLDIEISENYGETIRNTTIDKEIK